MALAGARRIDLNACEGSRGACSVEAATIRAASQPPERTSRGCWRRRNARPTNAVLAHQGAETRGGAIPTRPKDSCSRSVARDRVAAVGMAGEPSDEPAGGCAAELAATRGPRLGSRDSLNATAHGRCPPLGDRLERVEILRVETIGVVTAQVTVFRRGMPRSVSSCRGSARMQDRRSSPLAPE